MIISPQSGNDDGDDDDDNDPSWHFDSAEAAAAATMITAEVVANKRPIKDDNMPILVSNTILSATMMIKKIIDKDGKDRFCKTAAEYQLDNHQVQEEPGFRAETNNK